MNICEHEDQTWGKVLGRCLPPVVSFPFDGEGTQPFWYTDALVFYQEPPNLSPAEPQTCSNPTPEACPLLNVAETG